MIADKAAKKRGKGAHLLVPGGTFVMVSPELVRLLGGMAEAGLVGNLHQHCVRCADDDVPGRWQEGLCWVYGSHAHWAAQLGLTESGHEKLARRLTELGVILKRTDRARRAGARTWWAVDYDRLDELGYDASVDWKPVNRPQLRTPDRRCTRRADLGGGRGVVRTVLGKVPKADREGVGRTGFPEKGKVGRGFPGRA